MSSASRLEILNDERLIGGLVSELSNGFYYAGPITLHDSVNGVHTFTRDWVARGRGRGGEEGYSAWSFSDTVTIDHGYEAGRVTINHYTGEQILVRPVPNRSTEHPVYTSHVFSYRDTLGARLNPREVKGMPASLSNKATWDFPKIELDEEEWLTIENMPSGINRWIIKDALMRVGSQEGYVWPREQELIRYAGRVGYSRRKPEMQAVNPVIEKAISQLAGDIDLSTWPKPKQLS